MNDKEMKHTPGPWDVLSNYGERDRVLQANFKDNGGCYVCQTYGKDKQANARLIAAAPELLEACEKLLKRAVLGLEQSASHYGLTNCKAIGRAIGAIAKARGESND
jgi:hypothetical protein